jgi:hypothetical protein
LNINDITLIYGEYGELLSKIKFHSLLDTWAGPLSSIFVGNKSYCWWKENMEIP